jgi:hypothetical protein
MADGGMMADGGIVYESNKMVSKPYYFSSNAGLFTQKIYRIDNKFDDNRYLHADFPIGKGGYTKKEALEKANDFYDFVKSAKSKEEYDNLSEEYISNNRKRMMGEMADGGMMARGGRPLSAINRDRAYQSDEEWEKNYKRRSAPSNPRYNTED